MGRSHRLLGLLSVSIIIIGLCLFWFGQASQPIQKSEDSASAVAGVESQLILVAKVIDGDTIKLEDGSKVRLLGIDTPETKDIRKSVECFGKEASNETKGLLEGKKILLEKDVSETDKYGRLLRYIFLPLSGGRVLFVNDYLIRQGFAKALTYPPDVKYTEQFYEAQIEAKVERRGLWGRC